ncbi:MAG: NUDIX hydrolase [Mollicutes bacterium]|nr:NUDIX hydrolase [Mollicutes bacterium]
MKEYGLKSRAILINEKGQVLVANYGGVYLFPGGSIDENETIITALIRELKEEIGCDYEETELKFIVCSEFYQKDYLKRNGKVKNRLIKTNYFIGKYKGVLNINQKLTKKEMKNKFKLELLPLKDLKNINNNSRNIFFQKEIITILNTLEMELEL